MKKAMVILSVVLSCLVFSVSGCRYPVKAADFVDDTVEDVAFMGDGEEFAAPGESEADRRRKWERIESIQRQQMMDDIDSFWLMDKPSRLSDKLVR